MTGAFSLDGLYLAMETSGPVGHVAVGEGGEVLARARLDRQGQHAARLLLAVSATLEEASADLDDLAGIVVGEGPGSFTGVRVAAATAKGLALALQLPVWAVSSLAAAVLSDEGGRAAPAVRYVLFDARADRVYAACYGVGGIGVEALIPPHAATLRGILAARIPAGAVFVGDGAVRHRAVIESAGFTVLGSPFGEPTAEALLRFMDLHADTPPVPSLDTWEPRYLKASNAEREWTA
ncbi:MAG: tRNA (adenosine(37)-N6)-threonylcarbamoyltransferase complex dimerization subunit type 1 TsaB [Gemmatimonadetes bacterium]|nr:tRNA (adenosine(37)-N6)-threonylcarbamoyltransferase complex dimerization subunit type 1 TsaB [Gemmatimonadota bacterium]